jgi:predicted ATPase
VSQGLCFRSISLRNLLSFGSSGVDLELGPLTVLVGANGVGKSNLIEALGLLQAAPTDLGRPMREDGVSDWLWKGSNGNDAVLEVVLTPRLPTVRARDRRSPAAGGALRYRLAFGEEGGRLEVRDEVLEDAEPLPGHAEPIFYYRFQDGAPALNTVELDEAGRPTGNRGLRRLQRAALKSHQSILSQRREPDLYPELADVGDVLSKIRLYTEWNLGRYTAPRRPQDPQSEGGFLAEDAANLAIVLAEVRNDPTSFDQIVSGLREFLGGLDDVYTGLSGGKLQIYLRETALKRPVPGTRLSDGTIRFLCLLVILCHGNPPPLVVIEEPELGLHPDMITAVGRLLTEAAKRTQVIVTTHSDHLLAHFTDTPEAVVVCDRGPDGTLFRRLTDSDGDADLDLGARWLHGQLGGTRW